MNNSDFKNNIKYDKTYRQIIVENDDSDKKNNENNEKITVFGNINIEKIIFNNTFQRVLINNNFIKLDDLYNLDKMEYKIVINEDKFIKLYNYINKNINKFLINQEIDKDKYNNLFQIFNSLKNNKYLKNYIKQNIDNILKLLDISTNFVYDESTNLNVINSPDKNSDTTINTYPNPDDEENFFYIKCIKEDTDFEFFKFCLKQLFLFTYNENVLNECSKHFLGNDDQNNLNIRFKPSNGKNLKISKDYFTLLDNEQKEFLKTYLDTDIKTLYISWKKIYKLEESPLDNLLTIFYHTDYNKTLKEFSNIPIEYVEDVVFISENNLVPELLIDNRPTNTTPSVSPPPSDSPSASSSAPPSASSSADGNENGSGDENDDNDDFTFIREDDEKTGKINRLNIVYKDILVALHFNRDLKTQKSYIKKNKNQTSFNAKIRMNNKNKKYIKEEEVIELLKSQDEFSNNEDAKKFINDWKEKLKLESNGGGSTTTLGTALPNKLEEIFKKLENKSIYNTLFKKMIKSVGGYIIAVDDDGKNPELVLRKYKPAKTNNYGQWTYDSFGGYSDPHTLFYMINALRLELFDEGNIFITEQNLYSASPLIFKQNKPKSKDGSSIPPYILLQIFCLKRKYLKNLFSFENSGPHWEDNIKNNITLKNIKKKITSSQFKMGSNIVYLKLEKNSNNTYKIIDNDSKTDIIYQTNIIRNPILSSFIKLNNDRYIHKTINKGYENHNFIELFPTKGDYFTLLNDSEDLNELKEYIRDPWLPLSLTQQNNIFKE